ncbi:hypothetical protein AAW51_2111 [Caldimonas brevitalea]|uniref:Uncharacterized protein n=1 Tax=Caldimonas brevitalea TaxID=413882 RepID=A0A0G3BHJ1_9BURK|nr:hypothetical protein AAW51_2111 [Caldimonas brevitalea]
MRRQLYATTYAVFQPQRTDDLRPGAAAFIGQAGEFMEGWEIESGPYAGQRAMLVPMSWALRLAPMSWVPECDLVEVAR